MVQQLRAPNFPTDHSRDWSTRRQLPPAKSVDRVIAILEDFHSGKRDHADFWFNMRGKTIYIRYFAVRDTQNNYLGCLEVSQDITEIQQLEGEKRL